MAWRNLWRHGRRTWLTVGAMIFSNGLLVFSISLQFGSYTMMIDNGLQTFSGHIQLQHPAYLEQQKMRYTLADITSDTDTSVFVPDDDPSTTTDPTVREGGGTPWLLLLTDD